MATGKPIVSGLPYSQYDTLVSTLSKATYMIGLFAFNMSRPDKFALIKASCSFGKVEYVHKPAMMAMMKETVRVACSSWKAVAATMLRTDTIVNLMLI